MGETDTLKKWINESNYIVFFGGAGVSVSYTHLTLPTILLV